MPVTDLSSFYGGGGWDGGQALDPTILARQRMLAAAAAPAAPAAPAPGMTLTNNPIVNALRHFGGSAFAGLDPTYLMGGGPGAGPGGGGPGVGPPMQLAGATAPSPAGTVVNRFNSGAPVPGAPSGPGGGMAPGPDDPSILARQATAAQAQAAGPLDPSIAARQAAQAPGPMNSSIIARQKAQASPAAAATAKPAPRTQEGAPNLGFYPRFRTMQWQVPGSVRGPLSNAPIYTALDLFGRG